MERVILLRFSEIFLKGNNRKFFEKKLIDNIKETLKSYEYRFSTSQTDTSCPITTSTLKRKS